MNRVECPVIRQYDFTHSTSKSEIRECAEYLYYMGYISFDSYLGTWESNFITTLDAQICPQCNGAGIEKVQLLTSIREYPCSKCRGQKWI